MIEDGRVPKLCASECRYGMLAAERTPERCWIAGSPERRWIRVAGAPKRRCAGAPERWITLSTYTHANIRVAGRGARACMRAGPGAAACLRRQRGGRAEGRVVFNRILDEKTWNAFGSIGHGEHVGIFRSNKARELRVYEGRSAPARRPHLDLSRNLAVPNHISG